MGANGQWPAGSLSTLVSNLTPIPFYKRVRFQPRMFTLYRRLPLSTCVRFAFLGPKYRSVGGITPCTFTFWRDRQEESDPSSPGRATGRSPADRGSTPRGQAI